MDDRKLVAALIIKVITGQMLVRDAILHFPKDSQDVNIVTAYHALVHYEADEDLRRRDELYKDEQDDYLEFLANILEKGEDLPQNIIDNYKKYYDSAPVIHNRDTKGFLKSFFKILNIGRKKIK